MKKQLKTAIIYFEANFGELDGKTANGLIRHSEKSSCTEMYSLNKYIF